MDDDSKSSDRLQLRRPVWIGVVCEDLEAQKRFYRDVLGLSELKAGHDWVWFDFEGKLLELLAKSPLHRYDRRRVSFAFDVDDIEKVDDLVRALGMEGVSRSEVTRICSELDEGMKASRGVRSRSPTRTSGWMRRSTRCAGTVGWSPSPRSSRSGSRPPESGTSSASTWGSPRTRGSGGRSCARWSQGASRACAW